MSVPRTIHRTDPLPAFENVGKKRAVHELLAARRDAAELVAADQWRRFFQGSRFEKNLSANEEAAVPTVRAAKARIGAQRLQMVRQQVVGTLQSFVSNRANDVRTSSNGPAWTRSRNTSSTPLTHATTGSTG